MLALRWRLAQVVRQLYHETEAQRGCCAKGSVALPADMGFEEDREKGV